jgi:hypothetical protein
MTISSLNRERLSSYSNVSDSKPPRPSLTIWVRESDEVAWKEETEIISVSRTGAGFTSTRPCRVGRLVLLKTSLPSELRAYDHDAKIYSIIGLVQFCTESRIDGADLYNVGVGFIGKDAPNSFKKNPGQNYRITGAREDGLWVVKEADGPFKERKHPRYRVNVPVQITVVHDLDKTLNHDKAVTANVGQGGALVVTTLLGKVGEKVKFACEAVDFYSIAVIRGIRQNDKGPHLLHLQFLDGEFPVNRMLTGQMRSGEPEKEGGEDLQFFYR